MQVQQVGQAQILQGDAIEILRTLPDESVQMVCTSPPYYGLRDYGVVGQIGLERTPADYVALANRRLNSTTLGLPLEIAA